MPDPKERFNPRFIVFDAVRLGALRRWQELQS